MIQIDMEKVRATLPANGKVTLVKKDRGFHIDCDISKPSLSERFPLTYEKDYEQILDWQREIVGEALSEFYTETTGQFWTIYLKRVPITFLNL